MYDYLVDHAIQTVWCNPAQDRQFIVAPQRITPPVGHLNRTTILGRDLMLPTRNDRYHVFQIGHLFPIVLGLMPRTPVWTRERWIRLSAACTRHTMMANVYTDAGIQLPRHEVYYLASQEKNLILAVKENANIPINYRADTIYLRVYTNAYYQTMASDTAVDLIEIDGRTIVSRSELLNIQQHVLRLQSRHGHVRSYCNGFQIPLLSPVHVEIGDTVEWVYDASVKRVVSLQIEDCPLFHSSLDDQRKYLIHYPWTGREVIDYHDDVDLAVWSKATPERAVYYHRNLALACRMVTHRDYSIPVSHLKHFSDVLQRSLTTPIDPRSLWIELTIRRSGYDRPLTYEASRLHELYRLPDEEILAAMTGTHATVEFWTADHLESNAYTRLMRSGFKDITRALVQDAYGYHALSVLLGQTPAYTEPYSDKQRIHLPYGLTDHSTGYEYDAQGRYLRHHRHVGGSTYLAAHPDTRLIEMVHGHGSDRPYLVFGEDHLPVPEHDQYRVFYCHTTPEGYDEAWVDITDTEYYRVEDGILHWNGLDYRQFIMLRTESEFLAYDVNIIPTDGVLRFTLSEYEDRGAGYEHYTLPVPLGELDLFMNGYSLIEDIDYVVQHPDVVITNKKYLTARPGTTVQRIHVRYRGFAPSNLARDVHQDTGYVIHGTLSRNHTYDVREDRVLRILVDGRLHHREQLHFSEEDGTLRITDPLNGSPYSIRDLMVPMRQLINGTTNAIRAVSWEQDGIISDYLTPKLPDPDKPAPSAIPQRYPLYSPFISKILFDLYTRHYFHDAPLDPISDQMVVDRCQPYEEWLRFDPIRQSSRIDTKFVEIHPHHHDRTIELGFLEYRFLRRVIELYCPGQVSLSPFVTLRPLEDQP